MSKMINAFRSRSRAGGVAVMALILALVMLLVFQAYTTSVISDIGAGESLDRYTQYQGERVAIERLVKEAVLQYYESARMGVATDSIENVLKAFLTEMDASSSVDYAVTLPAFPSNASFWPVMDASPKSVGGAYSLYDDALESVVSKRRIANYVPNPAHVYQVRRGTGSGDDVFDVKITRTNGGETVEYHVYVRMYQVPVTDFNLISYAVASDVASLPDSPPELNSTLNGKSSADNFHSLCMTKMDADSAVNSTVNYPYAFRELFSSASLPWQLICYKDSYLKSFFTGKDFHSIMELVPLVDMSKDTLIAQEAFNLANPGSTLAPYNGISYDVDGSVTGTAKQWTIDLTDVPNNDPSATTDGIRSIYIQIPDTAVDSSVLIKDSAPGVEKTEHLGDANYGSGDPVFIWINGWSRAKLSPAIANYKIYLSGNLTDQDVYIFASGADIVAESGAEMNGAIILDDRLAGLEAAGTLPTGGFKVHGLIAWSGTNGDVKMNGPIDVIPWNDTYTSHFRAYAPRFLLVDAQSIININP